MVSHLIKGRRIRQEKLLAVVFPGLECVVDLDNLMLRLDLGDSTFSGRLTRAIHQLQED